MRDIGNPQRRPLPTACCCRYRRRLSLPPPSPLPRRFHVQLQQQAAMIEADEADQQHVEDVYEEAQAGLFDRDRETRRMLDGTPLSAGPSLRTTGTPPGGAPSTGGSPGDGPPRMARPTAQTMLRRQASGAETHSEGTSADVDDVLQTAQLMGG